MLTSSVRHPQGSRYLKIFDWQLEATNNHQAAAALINFFAYHHDRLYAALKHAQEHRELLSPAGVKAVLNDKCWQFHKDDYIVNGLLGLWKRDTIRKGIEVLDGLRFIETNPPEELKALYKVGRVKGFRFRADNVRHWLDAYHARMFPSSPGSPGEPPAESPAPAQKRSKARDADDAVKDEPETLVAAARAVFEDWKVVHHHPTSLETGERLRPIIKLLKAGYSVERMMIANRGLLFSEHHQGKNDRGRTYDRIGLIFETADRMENFEALARSRGVNENNLPQFAKKAKTEQNLPDKPDWQRAIDNCPLCDEKGFREIDGRPTKCHHPKE